MIAIIGNHPAAPSLQAVADALRTAGEKVEWWGERTPELAREPYPGLDQDAPHEVLDYYRWWREHCPEEQQTNSPLGPWAPEGWASHTIARAWMHHWREKISQRRPDVVVTWGSSHVPSRAALRCMNRHWHTGGLRTVCIEEGLFPAREGRSFMVDDGRSYYEWGAIEWGIQRYRDSGGRLGGAERKERLDAYRHWWRENRRTKHEAHVGDAELPDKWYWSYSNLVVFGQVPWDAAVWASDPSGHKRHTMMRDVTRSGEEQIWYKPHPWWPVNPTPFKSLPADASIHRLLYRMRGGVAVSSGVLYELALHGVPAVAYAGIDAPSSRGILWSVRDLDDWSNSWLEGARWELLAFLIHEYQVTTADPMRLADRVCGRAWQPVPGCRTLGMLPR